MAGLGCKCGPFPGSGVVGYWWVIGGAEETISNLLVDNRI